MIMWRPPAQLELLEKFGKYTKTAGIIFVILGLLSIIFPFATSIAVVVFVSWLMLFAGLLVGYFTFMTDKSDWAGWLKSFILIGVALYMILSPLSGVATLGLLFSIYFFMDAFSGFMMASSFYPNRGWGLWAVNAVLSLVIAVVFVVGWPFTSLYLIGLLVGFSLFFDGLVLLLGVKALKDTLDEEK
jgi:uncharacterized membrane protein HdeD (DUF308 family)